MKSNTSQYIRSKEWGAVFASLSSNEKKIVVGFARSDKSNVAGVALLVMIPRASMHEYIKRLLSFDLLQLVGEAPAGKLYAIADEEFKTYCNQVDKAALWADVDNDISNDLYQFLVQKFEALEHLRLIRGNGHHMAQKVSTEVLSEIKSRWIVTEKQS